MSLRNHFFFSPIFSKTLQPQIVLKAGRQLGKTASITARLLFQMAIRPGHINLIVLPLQEQADRMSSLIFRPILQDSPISKYLGFNENDKINASVRRVVCRNGSITHFQYTGEDATRIRQITADWIYIDEAQDHLLEQIPIVDQCLSSRLETVKFISGTSKSNFTYLEENWQRSSQGIWHIFCESCGFENICCVEERGGHLFKMMGPARDDITPERSALLCVSCRSPLCPANGRWVHRFPERLREFPGYYIPQPISPIHCGYPHKWNTILARWNGLDNYTLDKFYNEVLGETYDTAFNLVGIEDLKKVACLGPNTLEHAKKFLQNYHITVLGVDWGGGGAEGVSRTKLAFAGFNPDGTVDILLGMDFPPTSDFVGEARKVLQIANELQVKFIAHDYNGAISREAFLVHIGWPLENLLPMVYRNNLGNDIIEFQAPAKFRTRGYYVMDKARTLQLLCSYIKTGKIRFFDYDYKGPNSPGLIHDFLALVEEKIETPTGEAYRIRKSDSLLSDDFAHAVNYAVFGGWLMTGWWPTLTKQNSLVQQQFLNTLL